LVKAPGSVEVGRGGRKSGTEMGWLEMPQLCVPLRLGGSTEGARRPRRQTQNRKGAACASTRSRFMQWI